MVVTPDQLIKAALEYAAFGWKVLPVHHPLENGRCSCPYGSECRSPGKHPIGKGWQTQATSDEDEIAKIWTRFPNANVGVLLGQGSNLIDLETDTPEEEKRFRDLFGGELPVTCWFKGARGNHYLFRWCENLPNQAVCDKLGFGARIGVGNKGAQSVFPPSMHASGHQYTWGLHPSEVGPAELSPEIVTRMWNLAGEDPAAATREPSTRQKIYTQKKILVGERDVVLYAEACAMWNEQFRVYGIECFNNPKSQGVVHERLYCINVAKCEIPLEERVIHEKVESARKFVAKEAEASMISRGVKLTALGLEFREGEWWPGLWKTETVNSDPPIIRLHAPFLPKGHIELLPENYDSARKVHQAVLGATGTVCLDDGVLPWFQIWKGHKTKKTENQPSRAVRGLAAKLLDNAEKIEAPDEIKRENVIAAFVWDKLSDAQETKEGQQPSPRKPFLKDGNVIFSFDWLRKGLGMNLDQITRNELSRFLRSCSAAESFMRIGKKNIRFMRLPNVGFSKVRELSNGRFETI